MMRILLVAAALVWTMASPAPATARDGQPVTMRAILYEEDPSNKQGDRADGQVTWRTEPTKDALASPGDVTIYGDVEIPARKLRMTISIRRNFDQALPASHTVQIDLDSSPDFAGGNIKNIPGLLMKADEQAKGAPLAALSVRIDDRHFLMGLSAVPADASHNSLLIRNKAWMDIPILYASQRRAILAVEKDGDALPLFNAVFN